MEKIRIKQRASDLKNKEDLLSLINDIKAEDYPEVKDSYTLKQLNYYCNNNNDPEKYFSFEIPKKSGGVREISAPYDSLKGILSYVNEILKSLYTPSDYAMGFTEGRSVVDNAKIHTGQNYIFNIDLKDFFPSIEQPRVWKRLQLPPFNFCQEVASVIAGLCCMKKIYISEDGLSYIRYILPQGAPTSPIITNMICDNLDRRLAGLAKRFHLRYSRYADDITFSSQQNVYSKDGEFNKELHRIIEGQNFVVNEKKTRLQKRGVRQEVTGIIVSEKVNVTRKYVREVRNLLYMLEKYDFDDVYSKFYNKYKAEKGHVKKGLPNIQNVLEGKLLYLKMVKGDDDPVYLKLKNKFDRIFHNLSEILNDLYNSDFKNLDKLL